MTADRIKALEEALRTKAAMIELGEKIAWGSDVALMREAADALAASRAASDCQQQDLVTATRVKPLVWNDDPSSALDCAWIDVFGLYQITDEDVLFIGHDCIGTAHKTTEAAKAAAQADYEARILSALDLTPPTPQDAARVPEIAALIEGGAGLKLIIEEIYGAMTHGTWRDENGRRLKDTQEWVKFYNALSAIRAIAGGDA